MAHGRPSSSVELSLWQSEHGFTTLGISVPLRSSSHLDSKVKSLTRKTMTSSRPNVQPDGRYTTNETCALLGIKSRNTLRSWVAQGLIKQGTRRTNGRPFFLGSEILKCWSAVS